jgi:predicted DNA-binding transcriptional regulator AlpA
METLIDVNELARVLRRSPATIKRDLRRNPAAVPPRTSLPGTRLLRWSVADVQVWLAAHSGASTSRSLCK